MSRGEKSEHKGYAALLESLRTGKTVECGECQQPRSVGRACQNTECKAYKPSTPQEDDQFIAMLQRNIRALEARAIADPSILAQVLMLAQRLAEIPNVVIAVSSDTYKVDQYAAPSMREIAAVLGMKPQSAWDRLNKGEATIETRLEELGLGSLTAAKKEKKSREYAAKHAAETMPEWQERRNAMRIVA